MYYNRTRVSDQVCIQMSNALITSTERVIHVNYIQLEGPWFFFSSFLLSLNIAGPRSYRDRAHISKVASVEIMPQVLCPIMYLCIAKRKSLCWHKKPLKEQLYFSTLLSCDLS